MYAHASECRVVMQNSMRLMRGVSLAEWGATTVDRGMQRSFLFVDGEAVLCALENGLLMRAAANNVLSYHGIRTVLEGGVLNLTKLSAEEFNWLPSGKCTPEQRRES